MAIQQMDDLILAVDMRFAFSILVLCVPILSFCGILALVFFAVKKATSNLNNEDSVNTYNGV